MSGNEDESRVEFSRVQSSSVDSWVPKPAFDVSELLENLRGQRTSEHIEKVAATSDKRHHNRFVTRVDGLELFFTDAGQIEQQGRRVVKERNKVAVERKKHRSRWNYDHGWEQPSTPSSSWQWSKDRNSWRSKGEGWNERAEDMNPKVPCKLELADTCA